MMEFERSGRGVVAAPLTSATSRCDELRLELRAFLLLITVGLGVPAPATMFDEFAGCERAGGLPGRVVDSEGRTSQTEPASVERVDGGANDSLRRKSPATVRACSALDRTRDWLPRTTQRPMWSTGEAPFSPTQVEPNAAQAHDLREGAATVLTDEHASNVSSIA
jgi:hypothetical protein